MLIDVKLHKKKIKKIKKIATTREQLLASKGCAPDKLDSFVIAKLKDLAIGLNLPRNRRSRRGGVRQRQIETVITTRPVCSRTPPLTSPVTHSKLIYYTVASSTDRFPSLDSPTGEGFRVVSFNAQSVKSDDMAEKRC